jgi:hypothetical protein
MLLAVSVNCYRIFEYLSSSSYPTPTLDISAIWRRAAQYMDVITEGLHSFLDLHGIGETSLVV